jgi:hypothetical protein
MKRVLIYFAIFIATIISIVSLTDQGWCDATPPDEVGLHPSPDPSIKNITWMIQTLDENGTLSGSFPSAKATPILLPAYIAKQWGCSLEPAIIEGKAITRSTMCTHKNWNGIIDSVFSSAVSCRTDDIHSGAEATFLKLIVAEPKNGQPILRKVDVTIICTLEN